ncbi:hypothetical protein P7C70_g5113, partial [Phenoliferia sp. Uapishka_3]
MIIPTPTPFSVDGGVKQLRHALSESALIQHPPTPGRLSLSGNSRIDMMLETLYRYFPVLLMPETAISAVDDHPAIITARSLALSMSQPGSEVVALEERDRAIDKYLPGFIRSKIKHGSDVEVIGVGIVHCNVYCIDPEYATCPWLLDIFRRLDCLTFSNVPLAVRAINAGVKTFAQGVVRLRQVAYKIQAEDGSWGIQASTDPFRKLIRAPQVGVAKDGQVHDKKDTTTTDPRRKASANSAPVLGKSDPEAVLLNPSEPTAKSTALNGDSHKRKASPPRLSTHGHAPTTRGLFGQCLKLRREEDWRAEAKPDATGSAKYPGSRLPSRLPPRKPDMAEVERRLKEAKALASPPTKSTDNYLGKEDEEPGRLGIQKTNSLTMPQVPVAGPSTAPGIKAYKDCTEALEGFATGLVSSHETPRLTTEAKEPGAQDSYVAPTFTPCNSPVDALYGTISARLGRIGTGDYEQREAHDRRRQNELKEALEAANFAKSIEAAKNLADTSRQNLVSSFEDVLVERHAYWSRLQPCFENASSPIKRQNTPFNRCISPPTSSPYSRSSRPTRTRAIDLMDHPFDGYRYETSSVARPATYAGAASLPPTIYAMGTMELLTPVPELDLRDDGERSESTVVESPRDGLNATNPIVVGQESGASRSMTAPWQMVRDPVADDWNKVIKPDAWFKEYLPDGSWRWAKVDGSDLRHRGSRKLHNIPRPRTPSPVLRTLTDIDNHREVDYDDCYTPMDTEDSGERDEFLDYEVRTLTKLGRQSKRNISHAKDNWNRAIRAHVKVEKMMAEHRWKNSREKAAVMGTRRDRRRS